MTNQHEKQEPESKPKRYVSKAPRPIEGVRTSGHVWQPSQADLDQELVQIPDCTPFVPPKLAARTAVIVAEAARKFPVRVQMPELCKYVIAELTPSFRDTVTTGTVKANLALSQMSGLFHELLSLNSDNTNRWMLGGPGATAASFEYPLEQTLRQSAEWLAFATVISDAEAKAQGSEQPQVAASGTPSLTWQDIEIVFLSEYSVQVFVSGKPGQPYNYAEFGFEDGRNGKPIAAWSILSKMAESGGVVPRPLPGKDKKQVQKRIEEIREKLKAHYKIEADPIPFNGDTYQASFKIRRGPSFNL